MGFKDGVREASELCGIEAWRFGGIGASQSKDSPNFLKYI